MVAAADGPIDASNPAVLFYCWTDDARGLHAELESPAWTSARSSTRSTCVPGEFEVVDPDGCVVLVGQLDVATPAAG